MSVHRLDTFEFRGFEIDHAGRLMAQFTSVAGDVRRIAVEGGQYPLSESEELPDRLQRDLAKRGRELLADDGRAGVYSYGGLRR